jgi:hypothetical protein
MSHEVPSRFAVVPSVLLLACFVAIGAGATPARIPEARTTDTPRRRVMLDDLDVAANRATVFVFFSAECPLAQKYSPVVESPHQRYCQRDVQFYGVFAGVLADDGGASTFPHDYKLTMPFLEDRDLRLATELGASTTPEVVVVDKDHEIAYRGQIDNWYYGLGKRRTQATRHYLRDTLDALLTERRPPVTRTEPIGCLIRALPR